jgi:hypothetical protein
MATSKQKSRVEALSKGETYTWTIPDGGYLASMRGALKHGQTLTISPIKEESEIQKGDIVLVKWHKGQILHLVGEIQEHQFLIVNSLGKNNGWVSAQEILGRVTEVIEPEFRPPVSIILDQLADTFGKLSEKKNASDLEKLQLNGIVNDLRDYAKRLGDDRLYVNPRSNKWSYEQNLWYFSKQARNLLESGSQDLQYIIDYGKQLVGCVSGILFLFDYPDVESF